MRLLLLPNVWPGNKPLINAVNGVYPPRNLTCQSLKSYGAAPCRSSNHLHRALSGEGDRASFPRLVFKPIEHLT